jgi:CRP-like cAMP-binding protein
MSPPAASRVPSENQLLAALPPGESRRLAHDLESVPLTYKAVLHQPGLAIPHVFFPTSGVVSLVTVTADGKRIEDGLVGPEGLIGLPVFLGSDIAMYQAIVLVPGQALRITADAFRTRVNGDGALHRVLLRYTNAFLTEVMQSVACNALHTVKQRCCRWLLMTQVRAGTDDFRITHEFLAGMLSVRRASVSEVAQSLEDAGLIRCGRGYVKILDRRGLGAAACECHHVVQAEFDRMLG